MIWWSGRRGALLAAWCPAALIAAWFRLSGLSLVEFKYDEARVARLADLLVHQGKVPETSIVTSAGVQNSPLAIYLLAPAAAISWRPEVLTGFVAALNVIAVVMTSLLVSRYWGARAGGIAGVLYAAAPIAIQYSRKIWAPELMPALSVVCLSCLILAFAERKFSFIIPAVAAWSALVQLHQAAIWLAPAFVVLLIVGFRAVRPMPLALAIVVGIVVAAPYLTYESGHGWDDLRQLVALAGKPGSLSAAPWWYAWALGSGWGLPSFVGPSDRVLSPLATARTWFDVVGLALFVVGVAALSWRVISGMPRLASNRSGHEAGQSPSTNNQRVADVGATSRRSATMVALAVLLWTALPLLGLTRTALPVFPHYLLSWYPAPFVVAAIGIDQVARLTAKLGSRLVVQSHRWPWAAAVVSLSLTGLLVAGDVVRTIRFRDLVAVRHGGGEYGAPLRDSEAMVARTLEGGAATRRYVADRGDLPAVYDYLDRPGGAVNVEPDLALVLPPSNVAGDFVYAEGAFRGLDALRRVPGVSESRLPGGYLWLREAPSGLETGNPGIRDLHFNSAIGLDLTGWEGDSTVHVGSSLAVTLWWRVTKTAPHPDGELKVFTHLLDPQRKTVAQHDALGYAPRFWIQGERLATFFTLPIPANAQPGQLDLVGGLYTLPGFGAIQVTGPGGQSMGTEIPLGTVTVQ